MASPVWQTATTLSGAPDTSAVIAIPGAPLTALDVILVTLYKENTAAVTPHSGYVEKGPAPTTTAPQAQHTFWFRAAGGETGNLTFSWSGSVWRAATAHRITGCVTTGDPIQDIVTAFSNTSVGSLPVSLAAGSGDTLLYLAQTDWTGGNVWSSPGGFTERSDIDALGDTTKSNPGALASGSVSQTANVSGPMTSVLLSLASAAPADAGLWVPQNRGIILPSNPLYFPFTTPWAGQDVTAQAASGDGTAPQRSSSAAAGQKAASGSGLTTQRSAPTATGQRSAAGTAAAAQRSATTSSGTKSVSAAGLAVAHAATASTGRKGVTASAAVSQHSTTGTAGAKAATGSGQNQLRSATLSTGVGSTGITGAGAVRQRSSTTSTGRKGATAATGATCRVSTLGTGVHRGTGTGTAYARVSTIAAGVRRAVGAALAAARAAATVSGTRAASGAARVHQRSVTDSAKGIPFIPALTPTAVTRDPDGTAVTNHLHATATTRDLDGTATTRENE